MTQLWPPGRLRSECLGNGLQVLVLQNEDAPVVTSALTYRVGARDDPAGFGGLAHFLEHMMFKGSAAFAAGEVDRQTLALGGSNNAFTSHDGSTYYFSFSRDCWEVALEIEADRMSNLVLDADHVESERSVILEEIAMYQAEPWEALERAVRSALFGSHSYSRPVLGESGEVESISREQIARLHRQRYRPDGAVLAIVGGVEHDVVERVAELFGPLDVGGSVRRTEPQAAVPDHLARLEVERGDVARLLLALPVCPGDHADHAPLMLLAALLGAGRASRLNRRLVDGGELCTWASAETAESQLPGSFGIAAELLPGVAPSAVEDAVLTELALLLSGAIEPEELERARRVLLADWVFDHENVQRQALTLSHSAALFDAEHVGRQLDAIDACTVDRLTEVARRYLNVDAGAVLGWALPTPTGSGEGS